MKSFKRMAKNAGRMAAAVLDEVSRMPFWLGYVLGLVMESLSDS